MLHQAWSDGSFFPIINRSAASQLEPEATLIWTVDAGSWLEAMTKYHEWRGWKPYVSLDDDPVAYTAEDEIEAVRLLAIDEGIAGNATNTLTGRNNTAKRDTRNA
ncbi:MAG: hypothetical protein KDA78_09575 [Planctomycetaceae bacterium]|nr:hypothetical protein [Planctomycetaceae bacterium]